MPRQPLGIDLGATLCKLVLSSEPLETARFSSEDLTAVRAYIEARAPSLVAATGGGAGRLGATVAGIPVSLSPEFESWAHGAPILARAAGVELPERYLLVSLGTGTSILLVDRNKATRVGGSALGGGTLLGLGRLLLNESRFEEIVGLAQRGDRCSVDLLVGDIYRSGETPLPPELNAASFGKLASCDPADLAHALTGLIGENLALICGQLSRATGAELAVYCGSTLSANPALEEVLSSVTGAFGCDVRFLPNGAFCGAVGAIGLAQRRPTPERARHFD